MEIREKKLARGLSRLQLAILFILPSIFVIIFTLGYPISYGAWLSFQEYSLVGKEAPSFIGISNYIYAITQDSLFWVSLKNTLIYSIGTVALSFIVGFSIALTLNKPIAGRGFWRTLFFFPWVIPSVVVSLLFMWMFNANYGIVNYILLKLGLINEYMRWIISPNLAMLTLIIITAWKLTPFMMVMFLAGLQTIPKEQVEAAIVDGAKGIQIFRYVTIPNLREMIMIVTLMGMIWEFQDFTYIWVITKGGPITATTTWPIYIYKTAFRFFDLGYASSMGVIWMIAILILSIFYIKYLGSEEY
jgi:multiple sugar transport system permease protein